MEKQGKVCSKCGVWKALEEFNKNKHHKDGRQYECRECTKKYSKQWRGNNLEYNKQWREDNKEHIEEYNKQWRENNKEHIKEKHKQWRENNKEYIKEYKKQHYKDNEEYIKEYEKQYYKDNKEHIKEYTKQYYETVKQNNLQYISSLLEQINLIFKELNLPVYGYIYKFENIKTGHVYIGQTIRPLDRRYKNGIINGWIKERKEKANQKYLDELIEEDIMVTELFDVGCCKWHLNAVEAYWINYYDSYNDGYNNNAGHHKDDEGFEEFVEMLQQCNAEFIDGQIVKIA